MEAKYIAASEAAKEAIWLRNFLIELEVVEHIDRPMTLHCDNSAAIAQTMNPKFHKGIRHIQRKHHVVRDIVKRGDILVAKIAAKHNLADPFTKALPIKMFDRHMENMGIRYWSVKEWKEALREVRALKGWDVNKTTEGYQAKLIKEKIVPTVLLALKKNYMVVSDNLVGIDKHVNEMMKLLKVGTNGVRIVGIHGMGGIGKTTIAKLIYNKLFECFDCCHFLENIRETVQQYKGLDSLQNKLLTRNLKSCPDIANTESGIDMVKQRFFRKKVLIVLDDVDERSQFDNIIGKRDWFGPTSRIIITTRDKHVLNVIGVDGTYEPRQLDYEQSLQLFSMHAFRRGFPPKEYLSISREVASTAGGLPLALEVIGSFLSDKKKKVWEDTLKKLKKIPNDKIQKKLRISYEALNYEQQQIFLDIACHFNGMDKTFVFYMWDDCGYYPEKEISILCLMSLLRDFGREIVRQENLKNPGKRSRLWDHEEALDMMEEQSGTEEVETLMLEYMKHQPCYTNEEFVKLVNLRYLQMDGADLAGDFRHLFSRLRWLQWRGCPWHFKPTNFYLKNLVVLDVSRSDISEDWEGWNQIKIAKKLKVLNLNICAFTRTPDFSPYVTSEILILSNCFKLVEIDPSIGNMKNLKVLNISYSQIRALPYEVWMLEKLEELHFIRIYSHAETPRDLGKLLKLKKLTLDFCSIRTIPKEFGLLSQLRDLQVRFCLYLHSILGLPSSLVETEVQGLGKLESLISLDMVTCNKIVELDLLQHLACLAKGTDVTSKLKKLRRLQFFDCPGLHTIHGLDKLELLEHMILSGCTSIVRPPCLSNFKRLRFLILQNCRNLRELDGLEALEFLEELNVFGCISLENIPRLPSTLIRVLKDPCSDKNQKPASDFRLLADASKLVPRSSPTQADLILTAGTRATMAGTRSCEGELTAKTWLLGIMKETRS
ncbi:disease resistance protein RPV1-like [Cornus florida]|uniref:disease resistance protein RPV1-like n=1 Tax=Cornus florida TaxID=4283 RepID=UPI002897841C|nr:disease resistance protein RPV1-like [Cornus florida]